MALQRVRIREHVAIFDIVEKQIAGSKVVGYRGPVFHVLARNWTPEKG
jgi:hypothetical protein